MESLIGWSASFILLLTIGSQVYKQWRSGTSRGVSYWLFTGQVTASLGFVVYSWMIGSLVFIITNALILAEAVLGFALTHVQKRRERHQARA
jgi:MtN3 and saliva related transmembrane protein